MVTAAPAEIIIVVGAGGKDEYAQEFAASAELWVESATSDGKKVTRIGPPQGKAKDAPEDREVLSKAIATAAEEKESPLWIVLIGHGTFDGRTSKFNLRGRDVSAAELAKWLAPVKRPLAVVNCSSASGAFINELSGRDRVIVTATRSGYEHNYSRFGKYLAEVISESDIDLDKDGQTSLLEAFLEASSRTAEFYDTESRLATEHALIDDNGDGFGTPADWFRGARAVKRPKKGSATPDGRNTSRFVLARKGEKRELSKDFLEQRGELEGRIEALREKKKDLEEDAYYAQLETLMVELAKLYERSAATK